MSPFCAISPSAQNTVKVCFIYTSEWMGFRSGVMNELSPMFPSRINKQVPIITMLHLYWGSITMMSPSNCHALWQWWDKGTTPPLAVSALMPHQNIPHNVKNNSWEVHIDIFFSIDCAMPLPQTYSTSENKMWVICIWALALQSHTVLWMLVWQLIGWTSACKHCVINWSRPTWEGITI